MLALDECSDRLTHWSPVIRIGLVAGDIRSADVRCLRCLFHHYKPNFRQKPTAVNEIDDDDDDDDGICRARHK